MTSLVILTVLCLPAIALVVFSIINLRKSKPLFDQIETYQNATWANLAANRAYQDVTSAILNGAGNEETDALRAKAESLHRQAREITAAAYRKYPEPNGDQL